MVLEGRTLGGLTRRFLGLIKGEWHILQEHSIKEQTVSILTICIFNPSGFLFFHLRLERNGNKRLKIYIFLIDSGI